MKTQRDLEWVKNAPCFFARGMDHTVTDDHRNELFQNLDMSFVSESFSGSGRLGLYYEFLVRHLLVARFGTQNVLSNLSVRQNPQNTLGELDFVFFDGNQTYHWETSIKFYLHVPQLPHWKALVGPGVKDRFDIKGNHTFNHQLPLSLTTYAQSLLPEHWRNVPLIRQAFCQGYIFRPWAADSVLPQGISPRIATHQMPTFWCTLQQLAAVFEYYKADSQCALHRLDWLTGPENPKLETLASITKQTIDLLSQRNECMHLFLYRNGCVVARIMLAGEHFTEGIKKVIAEYSIH